MLLDSSPELCGSKASHPNGEQGRCPMGRGRPKALTPCGEGPVSTSELPHRTQTRQQGGRSQGRPGLGRSRCCPAPGGLGVPPGSLCRPRCFPQIRGYLCFAFRERFVGREAQGLPALCSDTWHLWGRRRCCLRPWPEPCTMPEVCKAGRSPWGTCRPSSSQPRP